jgi:hypothetical protein
MTVYLLAHLLLAANPESRQNIDGLTATVLVLVLAAEPHLWAARYFAVVTAGALAISTVWFPGNYVGALGLQTQMERLAHVYGSVATSPIAHPVFLRQALYVGALAVAVWFVGRLQLVRTNERASRSRTGCTRGGTRGSRR